MFQLISYIFLKTEMLNNILSVWGYMTTFSKFLLQRSVKLQECDLCHMKDKGVICAISACARLE
jgi:hypothetical protein